jgi:phage-related protein
MEMLATKPAEMGMAVGRLKQLSADEATRLRYEARELYLMDEMAVYVLHCFQKKTMKTSKADIDLAAKRYSDVSKAYRQ